ncbi:MAG: dUTP diphosphatase [Euryarchaeota archaeon]|nr:dUTP diphosphatase [Euryarchaeota archaeon]|tara:strand:+ start:19012 stop:19449 length:438 start_codon:yes stop_codon:yes gene_type:complete
MRISKVREVKTPTRGTDKSAGIDFYVPRSTEYITLSPGESCLIPSGIKADVPKDHALIAFNKSGVAVKKGLHVGASVVDEDYQGEIHINLMNVSDKEVVISPGEKIIQFLLVPVFYDSIEVVEEENLFKAVTERGTGGFGSTGVS